MPTSDPPDFELAIYQRIWEMLLGYDPWSAEFEDGSIIRFDTDETNADPEKSERADGDYPEAMLEPLGGSSTNRAADQTLGTYSNDGCAEWLEAQTHSFRLTVTSRKLTLLEQSKVRKLTINALRLAGPRLGLDYVTNFSWRWSVERREMGDEDRTFRQVTFFDLAVESLTEGPRLTGAR